MLWQLLRSRIERGCKHSEEGRKEASATSKKSNPAKKNPTIGPLQRPSQASSILLIDAVIFSSINTADVRTITVTSTILITQAWAHCGPS